MHNIAWYYRQVSTHKVAKIQLLLTEIHYTELYRIYGVENEVLAKIHYTKF